MKQIKRIMIVTLALVLAVSLSLTVFAATASQDGLELSVTTDKTSYYASDRITVTIKVTNTNQYDVNNVILESSTPEGYHPIEEGSDAIAIDSLAAGASSTLTVVFVSDSQASGGSTRPEFHWQIPGVIETPQGSSDNTENEAVEVDAPTEGGVNESEDVTVTIKKNTGLWILLIVLSSLGLVMLIVGRKNIKKGMSLILCITMLIGLSETLSVDVQAE